MDIVRSFKRGLVENKNLIFFSIILSLFLRLGFLLSAVGYESTHVGGGYLWGDLVLRILSDKFVSSAFSFAFSIGVGFYLGQINTRYALIRTRTYLVPSLVIVTFSLHPDFVFMTPQYVGTMCVLLAIYSLLSMYHDPKASGKAFSIGFVLAIGSLFAFYTLTFLPLFLIGFIMMRSFRFRPIAAMLLGVISIYWLVFFAFLVQDNIEGFISPFLTLYPILDVSLNKPVFPDLYYLALVSVLGFILFFYYQANSFHDKIRIRTNILFFYLSFGLSILSCWFVLYDPRLDIYLIVVSGTLLLSHFLSLSVVKWKVILFYLLVLLCVVVYIYNL